MGGGRQGEEEGGNESWQEEVGRRKEGQDEEEKEEGRVNEGQLTEQSIADQILVRIIDFLQKPKLSTANIKVIQGQVFVRIIQYQCLLVKKTNRTQFSCQQRRA